MYKPTVLPVLYGCGTWSLTLREERRQRVFENRVVAGECRKLYNGELNDLYCTPYIFQVIKSRRMILAAHVALWGEEMCIQGFGGET